MRLRLVFEVFCKAMSHDKPGANGNVSGFALWVYAVFLRFSARRSPRMPSYNPLSALHRVIHEDFQHL
ncbi:hypothetical protein KBT16_01780, partial [Nostoc sp. CCCryo 231-06]|nr:hypothetical protein [Nostoc sp. CCCryo 231-06]